MIPPRQQWCIQIEVTNACTRRCSNCTRMLAHARAPFFMSVDDFARAIAAVRDFPAESEPDLYGRRKVIGIMGGEPLLHPQFDTLCRIMIEQVPQRHRGLWTGLPWRQTRHRAIIEDLLGAEPSTSTSPHQTAGYLNHNPHLIDCVHQPVLVAIRDVVDDEQRMWELIDRCWLQQNWSSAITPKGFFFCEVAAAFDTIFEGPGGLPINPACWQHDLAEYRAQIERWCPRCGICLPLAGRPDYEALDDVSRSNLQSLEQLKSPRIAASRYRLFDAGEYCEQTNRAGWNPSRYLRGEGSGTRGEK